MALKMTKEVKAFAEREFDKRVQVAREKFFAPETKEKNDLQKIVNDRIEQINQELSELSKSFGENISVEWGTNYRNDKKIIYGTVAFKKTKEFKAPDKIRFMAELSTGESLDDVSTMLDRFFS